MDKLHVKKVKTKFSVVSKTILQLSIKINLEFLPNMNKLAFILLKIYQNHNLKNNFLFFYRGFDVQDVNSTHFGQNSKTVFG